VVLGVSWTLPRSTVANRWFTNSALRAGPSAGEVRSSSFGQLAIAEHITFDSRDEHSERVTLSQSIERSSLENSVLSSRFLSILTERGVDSFRNQNILVTLTAYNTNNS
jgi:hypothetical protein